MSLRSILSLAVLASTFAIAITTAVADETRDQLDLAKKRQAEAAAKITEEFKKVVDAKLKTAVLEERLLDAKAIIAAKEELDAKGKIPAVYALRDEVSAYKQARKAAEIELLAAFDKAQEYYTSNGLLAEARKVADERAEFVKTERAASQIEASPADPPRPKTTEDHFAEFYERYTTLLENAAEKDTTAQALQAHGEMCDKLDDLLKTQTWTFRCLITDVEQGGVLQIGPPLETPGFSESWRFRDSVGNIGLSKSKLLGITSGDILLITATPRFSGDSSARDETKYFSTTVEVGDRTFIHAIHMTRHRFSVRKPTPEEKADLRDLESAIPTRGRRGR